VVVVTPPVACWTWRSVTDTSKDPAAAAATNNGGGGQCGGGVRWPLRWTLICRGQSNTATINKV